MTTKETVVTNPPGLHARSAATIVKLARSFTSTIEICHQDKIAFADNIMSLLMLEAICGSPLEVSAKGPDEAEAVFAIVSLIEDDFGEGPHQTQHV